MAHARTQIRNAVIAALSGLPTTGNRVYPGRSLPLDPERIGGAGLLVFSGDEPEIERITMGNPAIEQHSLLLHVRGVVKASSNLEDVLDQIALEVQTAMANSSAMQGGTAKSCDLVALQAGEDETLEKPAGMITLTYRCQYHIQANAPGVLI